MIIQSNNVESSLCNNFPILTLAKIACSDWCLNFHVQDQTQLFAAIKRQTRVWQSEQGNCNVSHDQLNKHSYYKGVLICGLPNGMQSKQE
jgi:hypothetical protein